MKQTLKVRVISGITAVMTVGAIVLPASFAQAISPTDVKDTLTRLKISTAARHTITGTFASSTWYNNTTVTFSYSAAGFALGDDSGIGCAIAGGGGTCTAASVASTDVVTVTCTGSAGCWGNLTLSNVTGTNPSSAGSKTITIAGTGLFTGSFAIPITTDDQVVVTATVDPTITFDVGAQAAATTCDGSFDSAANNDWVLALGTIAPNTLVSSDLNSRDHICTRLSTNATTGAVVTVSSTYSGLQSTSVPADRIPSATETLSTTGGSSASQGYGLCAGSAISSYGYDTTVPAGNAPTSSSPYNVTCTASTLTVGLLDGTGRPVMTVLGPVGNAYERLFIKAMIDATQEAHNDYTDTLTFLAAGTF